MYFGDIFRVLLQQGRSFDLVEVYGVSDLWFLASLASCRHYCTPNPLVKLLK